MIGGYDPQCGEDHQGADRPQVAQVRGIEWEEGKEPAEYRRGQNRDKKLNERVQNQTMRLLMTSKSKSSIISKASRNKGTIFPLHTKYNFDLIATR